jgi:hypothetical protein
VPSISKLSLYVVIALASGPREMQSTENIHLHYNLYESVAAEWEKGYSDYELTRGRGQGRQELCR